MSPNPDWVNSKRFAVIDANLTVSVIDFETSKAVHGHKAHETGEHRDKSKKITTAIVFLQQNAVVTTVRSTLVYYCLNTNKYRFYYDFAKAANPFSIFRQSPKEKDLLAGGTKDGLIVIISLAKMQIIRKFRGHDKEITSMDWRYLPVRPSKEVLQSKATTLEQDISATDPTDAFDLYDHKDVEEFGVYDSSSVSHRSDDKEDNNRSLQEKLANDEGFDFSEACANMKRDLVASQGNSKSNGTEMPTGNSFSGGDQSKTSFEDNKDKYGVRNPNDDASENDSLLSNASSSTPDLTEESQYNEAAGLSQGKGQDEIPVLATASHEHHANFWDVGSNDVQPMGSIRWNSKVKSPFPEPFANITFLHDDVVLIANGFGDVDEYKIEVNPTTRKMAVKDKKIKCYDVKGVLALAKSEDGNIVWTASIFRNITCFDVPNSYAKVASLDTIQPRINCIIESHHDPNIVAVSGNDSRVCLWNTSEVDYKTIRLRPFITKIKTSILCVAFHPDTEHVVAISTRDGRVFILDTSKPNIAPKPLEQYAKEEIYSIAWAKLKDSVILLGSNRDELVYYAFLNANDKPAIHLHRNSEIRGVSTLAVSDNLLAVGTVTGRLMIVDIQAQFQILDEMVMSEAKYISMMAWFEDMLAVATDKDVYMVRNIKRNIKQGKEPTSEEDLSLLPAEHKQRINSVAFNSKGTLLVSTCRGGLVKILDVNKEPGHEEVLATISLGTPAFCAIFLPSNEDLVICGGQDSTPTTYRWKAFLGKADNPLPKKRLDPHKAICWGKQEDFKNVGTQKVKVSEVAKCLENMQIDDPSSSAVSVTLHVMKLLVQFFSFFRHQRARVNQHQRKALFSMPSI